MSHAANRRPLSWKHWALALGFLVVSAIATIASLLGAPDPNSSLESFLRILSEVSFFAGLVWVTLLMMERLWPSKKN
jgi:hypothetical protein